MVGLMLVVTWLGAVAMWRYSSGGALAAFGVFPLVAAAARPSVAFVLFSVVVSSLIILNHKGNIERLWNGTESRIGQRRS